MSQHDEKLWDDDSMGVFISHEFLPESRRLDEDTRNFYASSARRLAFQVLKTMGVSKGLRDDVHIALSEFVGNAARHGDGLENLNVVYTKKPDQTVYVVVTNKVDEEAMQEVGSATDPADDKAERGRGFGIVGFLASSWGQYEVPASIGKRQIITYAVFHSGVVPPVNEQFPFSTDIAA